MNIKLNNTDTAIRVIAREGLEIGKPGASATLTLTAEYGKPPSLVLRDVPTAGPRSRDSDEREQRKFVWQVKEGRGVPVKVADGVMPGLAEFLQPQIDALYAGWTRSEEIGKPDVFDIDSDARVAVGRLEDVFSRIAMTDAAEVRIRGNAASSAQDAPGQGGTCGPACEFMADLCAAIEQVERVLGKHGIDAPVAWVFGSDADVEKVFNLFREHALQHGEEGMRDQTYHPDGMLVINGVAFASEE